MSKFQELINAEQPVLVDFHAEWCGPCKSLAPIIKEVKSEFGARLKIVKIDVDKNQLLARKLGIKGVPTMILYNGGKQLWRQSGVVPKNELIRIIQSHIA